jgi:murein DD-endopeptidase MepM/ murein hydrolase activator NlpD
VKYYRVRIGFMTQTPKNTGGLLLLQCLGLGLFAALPFPLHAATIEALSVPEAESVEPSSPNIEAPVATTLPDPVVVESVPRAAAAASLQTAEAEPIVVAPASSEVTHRAGSVFSIDPQDYSLKATATADAPAVILSERSSGCQAVLEPGAVVPGSLCSPRSKTASLRASSITQTSQGWKNGTQVASSYGVTTGQGQRSLWRSDTNAPNRQGSTLSLSKLYRGTNPLQWLGLTGKNLLFPIALPAQITSAFGWRLHPISGNWRLHSGTDIGAPIGTPVLATQDGEVLTADYLGGYGNTVILSHNQNQQESLYAHLSELLVSPGQKVKQGEVIGLVGSTGNSTGPHLHFELLQRTASGMAPVDAGPQLALALGELRRAIQIAQAQIKNTP